MNSIGKRGRWKTKGRHVTFERESDNYIPGVSGWRLGDELSQVWVTNHFYNNWRDAYNSALLSATLFGKRYKVKSIVTYPSQDIWWIINDI